MDALEALRSRRSIRSYRSDSIPDSIVAEILRAGMSAPTASGKRPWRFVVVRDTKKIKRMADALPNGSPLSGAPLAMAVCAITEGIESALWIQDCAAATDNMLLASHALGMGSAWIPLYPAGKGVDDIAKLLKLPPKAILFSIVVAGYPAESEQALDRYEHEFVHLEEWEE